MPHEAGAAWISPDGSQELLAISGRLYRHVAMGLWQSRKLPRAFAVEPVQAVVQDGRGYIWIRGRQTLLVLAGFETPVEDLSASLPGAAVQKGELCVDRTGRIWAPTNHGIAWFDGHQRGLLDVNRGLTNQWATTVMVDNATLMRSCQRSWLAAFASSGQIC